MKQLKKDRRLYWGVNGTATTPMRKLFLSEAKNGMSTPSILPEMPLNQHAARELELLFGQKSVFDTPKPVDLLRFLVKIGSNAGDIILDFFAGSGSLGQAVMAINSEDKPDRRFVLVQFPEVIAPEDGNEKIAAEYCRKIGKPFAITELTKERLRRAAVKVNAAAPMFSGDTGFRVFKLDTSNIRAWNPIPGDLESDLLTHLDHLLEGRNESDILYELLLKLGLDLCVPIETKTIYPQMVQMSADRKNPIHLRVSASSADHSTDSSADKPGLKVYRP
jgi:adenine-specific DNA-methyltransferase